MDKKNHFSEKFKDKSTDELKNIIDNADFQKDAQLAAAWELEKRDIAVEAKVIQKYEETKVEKEEIQTGRFLGKRFFTEKQSSLAAVLAGPIPAGILIYLNYKTFQKDREAYITLGITLILTFLLFAALFQLPEEIIDRIPSFLFGAIYGVFVYIFYRHQMTEAIEKAYKEGASKGSNWTVAAVSVIGLVLTIAMILLIASQEPYFEGERLEVNGNELFYDEHVPSENVMKLRNELVSSGFFGDGYGNAVRLGLVEQEYYITIAADESLWDDSESIAWFTSLKWKMEVEFNRPVYLQLESVSLSGNLKYKQITD